MVAASRTHQHKRHGKHQRHTKDFKKVYWPYIPLMLILSLGILFSAAWQPRQQRGVLAYATNMSVSGLLQSTNQQRVANGVGALALSTNLDSAAQAKANDMVNRNYWSHNTPEGNPPWIFINQTGYKYSAAGENLAYGFLTSSDTVGGWMNSPPHKENLLNGTFTQVGFGIANSSNYVDSGQQTVVVAFYATPVAAAAPAPTSASSAGQTKSESTTTPAPKPAPKPTATPKKEIAKETEKKEDPAPTTSDSSLNQPTKEVSRIAALTQGKAPWIASFSSILLIAAVVAFTVRHAIAIRKWVKRGEKYVLHHVVFDITIIALVGLIVIVSQGAGFIK